ncbi:ABC transporter substrate-binding protein [Exiguobacterium sp. SL14]|nr:ABC transporter substrate-binding protein [Exiguobacterium sp. SL14]MCY1691050.1 ABC transporter substrate-binding protein [Exiguobacterium sp. SL14]
MSTYKTTSLIGSVFLGLALAYCASSDTPQEQNHLTFVYNFATQSLDPHRDSSYVPLRAGVTETLVRLDDERLTVEPWLAKKWSYEGKRTWRIVLQDDVTFHNGKRLDFAVKSSLERSIQENPGVKNALNIETIKTDGPDLLIQTKTTYPEFISELVNPNTAIIDTEASGVTKEPMGTGPFQVDRFAPGTKVELKRFKSYWQAQAKLDSVDFVFNEDAGARTNALRA